MPSNSLDRCYRRERSGPDSSDRCYTGRECQGLTVRLGVRGDRSENLLVPPLSP